MKNWIAINSETIIGIFISLLFIYIVIILFTRIFGKRSFSKMSGFDFPMTIAVGSIIASIMLSPEPSIMQGILGLLDNSPLLLMDGSTVLKDNLLKARVTEADLRSKLREANVTQLSDIKAVIFETTGNINVLHKINDEEIDPWIMLDVDVK